MENVFVDSIDDDKRPVIATGNEYEARLEIPEHSHWREQLLYPSRGVVTVNTRHGSWVVPPERGIWIPANVVHSARMSGQVSMRSVYVHPRSARAARLPKSCCVVEVSPLLRALLEAAVDLPLGYKENGRESRIMALILDEIRATPVLPLSAPLPSNPALASLCRELLGKPETGVSIDQLAQGLGMSRSTFTRRFREETGLSFVKWRQQARFLEALRRIAAGDAITQVALDTGYASPSAFTSAFRQVLGRPPSRYFSR